MRAYRSKEILHLILSYSYITILLLISVADNFELSSLSSVTGNVGQDVILPCNIKSQEKPTEISWVKITNHTFENMYQFIPPIGEEIYGPDYKARVVVSKEGLDTGNVSLKLKNIQLSDGGMYTCFVKSSDRIDQIHIYLHIEYSGDPSISSCKYWILYFLCPCFLLVLICVLICKIKGKQNNTEVRNFENYPNLLEGPSKEEFDQLQAQNDQLMKEKNQLQVQYEILVAHFHKVDLTLDSKTAHPKLEVSEDGKSVTDTGNIQHVSMTKERFESHLFVLAEQGLSEGKYYWEVEVGQINMWDVGVASESAPRTGKITLSPQNGYWIIGCDRKYYWARTDPWTRLDMPDKPRRIGIYLNLKSHEISFYNPERKYKLHTFLHVASGKFYPFFSVGSLTEKNNGKLIIPPWSEKVEENKKHN